MVLSLRWHRQDYSAEVIVSRIDNLAKARKARTKNARKRLVERTWAALQPRLKRNPCKCNLKKGMTREDLRKLGAGCTAPAYICPNLDAYRRILEHPERT